MEGGVTMEKMAVVDQDKIKDLPLYIKSLTVLYNDKPVLWDVTWQVEKNRTVAIVGPNGAGKTTLLKSCLNLVSVATGKILFWGKSYKEAYLRVAYVPQKETVDWSFPVTVREVVLMGRYGRLGLVRRPTDEDYEIVDEKLKAVGMSDYAERQIADLSGGQQQRVFIARALAQEAELYLLDEPFTGVDAATEEAISGLFKEIKMKGGTVVAVHHDLLTVGDYFDDVLLLNQRVIDYGALDEVFNLSNLRRTYGARHTALEKIFHKIASRGNIRELEES